MDFPAASDHLPELPLAYEAGFAFTSVDPAVPLGAIMAPVRERVGWLPLERMRIDPGGVRDYTVQANWALHCDNYLEGFHIPFVHPSLASGLD